MTWPLKAVENDAVFVFSLPGLCAVPFSALLHGRVERESRGSSRAMFRCLRV
jgi:hypothetical protein